MRLLLPIVLMIAAILVMPEAGADELVYRVSGVEGEMAENVLAAVQPFRFTGRRRMDRRRLQVLSREAEIQAALALRPYGYYHATALAQSVRGDDGNWIIELNVTPGAPVMIRKLQVELTGPGANDDELRDWQAEFPLTTGQVLNQATWEEQKALALDRAEVHGYLSAHFTRRKIDIDLEANEADLDLLLHSGEQAVMGSIQLEQNAIREGVLELLPRWEPGQAYDQWLLEQYRLDLWRTGYFETIDVLEQRHLDRSPPTVDLVTKLGIRKKNTYQGSLGYGTDSGIRLNATWHRYLLSDRGDALNIGVGWQQRDNEYSLRAAYQLPRASSAHEFWTAEARYRSERHDLLVRPDDNSSELIRIARGTVEDYLLVPGMLRIRNLERGYQRIMEHWFVRVLSEKPTFSLVTDEFDQATPVPANTSFNTFGENTYSYAPGVSWEWPAVRGNGWETVGHRSRLDLFTSNKAWGSDIDFTQVYLYSAWNQIFGDRWKILLRGEVGWTNADVEQVTIDTGMTRFDVSLTDLPYAYRFKAGGSRSVRGYGFESLSNNNIGSNNIVTLSTEFEYRFAGSWSAAGFFDAGNAFNDWGNARLKKGYGVGIRWYSIAGAVRLDVAQALDESGQPWRVHFTIGTPLL